MQPEEESGKSTPFTVQQYLIIVLTVILMYLIYSEYMCEGMSPTRERANKIYNWFVSEDEPQYVKYRKDIEGAYNVEYYDIKNLKTAGQLSPDNVERVIS